MKFEVKIFDPDHGIVATLEEVFSDVKAITVQVVNKMLYLRPPSGIDILYLPLAVSERFGSKPLVHESQILSTSPEDQHNGLPAFVVTGACLARNDELSAIPELRLLLAAVFDAIRAFNQRQGPGLLE